MKNNREKIIILLLIITLIFSLFTIYVSSNTKLSISAKSAVLYEPSTETFIYRKNENQRLAMASTTKIITALIAIEKLDLESPITVDERAIGIEGSSIYLKSGEILTAEDLIYATMLQSANDAAAALAYEISGSIEEFSHLMNSRAESLGLSDTNFENPHGLDSKNHYTTSHDLAILTAEALKNEEFKNISSTYQKEIHSSLVTRILTNHNKLLKKYDGCIGVKTGYTQKSGRSLVSAAERDGLTLISVTIDAPNDWIDHSSLLDLGFSTLVVKTLANQDEYTYKLPVIGGTVDSVTVSNDIEIKRIFNVADADFDVEVKLSKYLVAPISESEIAGQVLFSKNGETIEKINLTTKEAVPKEKQNDFFKIFNK